jgi:putative membrane protein
MHGSVYDSPAFRPVTLVLCLVLSAVIFASWHILPLTQSWWHAADIAVFSALNGSLRNHVWWQQLWAIGNNHFFDFLSVLLMLWLVFRYITAENRRYIAERVSVFLMIVITIIIASLITNVMDAGKRASPSAVVEGAFLLSEHVSWLETKDISYNSYPSDHAAVLLIMSMMLWVFAGRRTGLIMLGAAVLFTFPRLIGGAHWFTDVMAGSVPLSIAIVALCVCTPLHRLIISGWMRLWHVPFFAACLEVGTHKDAPSLVAKGCCMGAADIVPGVSGGTMAYILGIWHALIEAVKSFDLQFFRYLLRFRLTDAINHAHVRFVVPLMFGIALAVVTFTKFIPIPKLIISHPEPIYGLFFGLIAGSVVLLLQETGKLSLKDVGMLVVGTAIGWLLVNVVPVQTPETWWFVFFCGCVAISAMLLPGISGSFILLILGKYAYILGGLGELNIAIILPFAAGCFTGLIAFSRGASWLLHHYYRQSVLTITGILIGSLWMIWPFQDRVYETVREKQRLVASTPTLPTELTTQGQFGMMLMAVGFGAVILLGIIATRKKNLNTLPIDTTPSPQD